MCLPFPHACTSVGGGEAETLKTKQRTGRAREPALPQTLVPFTRRRRREEGGHPLSAQEGCFSTRLPAFYLQFPVSPCRYSVIVLSPSYGWSLFLPFDQWAACPHCPHIPALWFGGHGPSPLQHCCALLPAIHDCAAGWQPSSNLGENRNAFFAAGKHLTGEREEEREALACTAAAACALWQHNLMALRRQAGDIPSHTGRHGRLEACISDTFCGAWAFHLDGTDIWGRHFGAGGRRVIVTRPLFILFPHSVSSSILFSLPGLWRFPHYYHSSVSINSLLLLQFAFLAFIFEMEDKPAFYSLSLRSVSLSPIS